MEAPAKCEKMVRFLRDAYEYVKRTPNMVLSEPQQDLQKENDARMPLRESSVSRAIVNSKPNPLHAQTRAGLFSLLLFRGISFNSKAFELAPAAMHPVSDR